MKSPKLCLLLTVFTAQFYATAQVKLPNPVTPSKINSGSRSTSTWMQYSQVLGITDAYGFKLNSRYPVNQTQQQLNITTMGTTIDSLIDWIGNSYDSDLPITIDTLALELLHENNTGTNDTIIVRILGADQNTGYPTQSVLWSDTIITNQSLFPGQTWLTPLDFVYFTPQITLTGKFHYDVQYYGALADTFGVVLSMWNCGGNAWNGNDDPIAGKVFRKTHSNTSYQPDLNGYDSSFYDANANLTFDPYSCEFSPYVYFESAVHINIQSVTIQGEVYLDLNSNSVKDAGEPGVPNVMITAGNGSALTDPSGFYTLLLDTGIYTPALTVPTYFGTTQISGSHTLLNYGDLATNVNFGLEATSLVNDLEVMYTSYVPPVPGMQHAAIINVINQGSTSQSPIVKMIHPTGAVLLSTNPVVSSVSGDTLIWNLPSQFPFANTSIQVIDSMPASVATLGDTIVWPVSVLPIANDIQPMNNNYTLPEIIIGSYDPNDKTPIPLGTGSAGNIWPGTPYIDYTIRFQNTGSYYAFNINITDTIDTDFDISSLQVLSTSHSPYEVELNPNREVIFKFPGIMLPDSNMNEPQSHGYVRYRIYLNPSLAIGTELTNTAYIFFDYNEAVITNTTLNTLDLPNTVIENTVEQITVYPNPSNGLVTINCPDAFLNGTIELTGVDGKQVYTSSLLSKSQSFTQLSEGLYLVTLYSADKTKTARARLVIKK